MTIRIAPFDGIQRVSPQPDDDSRPVKRLKIVGNGPNQRQDRSDDQATLVRRHTLGVRPAGNAFTSSVNLKDSCGLFAQLPDELLMLFLESQRAEDLLRLGGTCRALHAFTRNEELWRALFIESSPSSFTWQGTWRSTFLSQPSSTEPRVNCSNLFSDVLHRPFYCAHVSLSQYAEDIPERNSISRLSDLSPEDFQANWFNKPFILTSPVKKWPLYQSWMVDYLTEKYANTTFRAEAVDWPLQTYVNYMNNNHDESPLYLFDRSFAEKMNLDTSNDEAADYSPPACFGTDIFSVLGNQRPDHRWLIIGPARSGSTFHKDPNATSAWNAVIRGKKYWIMFPSSPSIPPPPGVYVSADQSEVTSPLSIAEWLLGFHAEARATPGCKEGICYEGEVLHVPSGWYHLVLNLEPSIAITQNFVPRARLAAVLQFLRDQKQSISGFGEQVQDPYTLLVERLQESDPELLQDGLMELEKLSEGGRSRWEKLTKSQETQDEEGGGFSFSFGADESDDETIE